MTSSLKWLSRGWEGEEAVRVEVILSVQISDLEKYLTSASKT